MAGLSESSDVALIENGAFPPEDDEFDDAALLEACQRAEQSIPPPLWRHRKGYLWVSDLSRQMWCEQQVDYTFSRPLAVQEPPHVTKGTELHLQRELETQEYVDVHTESNEDIFAVKLANLLSAVRGFTSGTKNVFREAPIFGVVEGVFLLGKIDELSMDPQTYEISLGEFKTRQRKCLPGRAQMRTHHLQVMVYKHLFDQLIQGQLPGESLWPALRLDPARALGASVQGHLGQMGNQCTNLSQLYRTLLDSCRALPQVSRIKIDYTFQGDGQPFTEQEVIFDESWLLDTVREHLKYWAGQRAPVGVDIEDVWKCESCGYVDDCAWRQRKAREAMGEK